MPSGVGNPGFLTDRSVGSKTFLLSYTDKCLPSWVVTRGTRDASALKHTQVVLGSAYRRQPGDFARRLADSDILRVARRLLQARRRTDKMHTAQLAHAADSTCIQGASKVFGHENDLRAKPVLYPAETRWVAVLLFCRTTASIYSKQCSLQGGTKPLQVSLVMLGLLLKSLPNHVQPWAGVRPRCLDSLFTYLSLPSVAAFAFADHDT